MRERHGLNLHISPSPLVAVAHQGISFSRHSLSVASRPSGTPLSRGTLRSLYYLPPGCSATTRTNKPRLTESHPPFPLAARDSLDATALLAVAVSSLFAACMNCCLRLLGFLLCVITPFLPPPPPSPNQSSKVNSVFFSLG